MRAAVFKGAAVPLQIETRPDPSPGERQIIVKVGRCGICGSDVHMTSGHGPTFATETVLGHEYAGEVVAVDGRVDGIRVGDNVTVLPMSGCGVCAACTAGEPLWCSACRSMTGGFGEYVVADARYALKLPSSLSLADGALVEPLASALQAVRLSDMEVGSRVLVFGAGAIGLGVVFWLRRLGAGTIVAVARSTRNAEIAHEVGASAFIAQGDGFDDRVEQAFGGKPDMVFDCAGSPGVFSQAVDVVRPKGKVVCAAMCFDPEEKFVAGNASWKQLRIQFSVAYRFGDFIYSVDTMSSGALEPRAMVSDTIGLEELPATLEGLRQGTVPHCKIMVDPSR